MVRSLKNVLMVIYTEACIFNFSSLQRLCTDQTTEERFGG